MKVHMLEVMNLMLEHAYFSKSKAQLWIMSNLSFCHLFNMDLSPVTGSE